MRLVHFARSAISRSLRLLGRKRLRLSNRGSSVCNQLTRMTVKDGWPSRAAVKHRPLADLGGFLWGLSGTFRQENDSPGLMIKRSVVWVTDDGANMIV